MDDLWSRVKAECVSDSWEDRTEGPFPMDLPGNYYCKPEYMHFINDVKPTVHVSQNSLAYWLAPQTFKNLWKPDAYSKVKGIDPIHGNGLFIAHYAIDGAKLKKHVSESLAFSVEFTSKTGGSNDPRNLVPFMNAFSRFARPAGIYTVWPNESIIIAEQSLTLEVMDAFKAEPANALARLIDIFGYSGKRRWENKKYVHIVDLLSKPREVHYELQN